MVTKGIEKRGKYHQHHIGLNKPIVTTIQKKNAFYSFIVNAFCGVTTAATRNNPAEKKTT